RVCRAGEAVGPKNLATDDRHLFFGVVKAVAEDAMKHDEVDRALEFFHLYTQYERAGLETYRKLAELYEQKKDPWSGLDCTMQGLQYDGQDKDLLAKKDRYYYSINPEELAPRWENIKKWFDPDYCKAKARFLLDKGGEDLELLDWAEHLLKLAARVQSDGIEVRMLQARLLRRRGEVGKAAALFEEIRNSKPEKFPSRDEEEAWYLTCRLLGDMVLHEKPELAVQCFQDYRKSSKSGADTVYKMGLAYEQLGDVARAVKCYKQVAAFDSHPLAPEANDALHRLGASARSARPPTLSWR